jgi:hypothetical protein
MLCELAWVIAGKRNTYLANWYWRLKSQKGTKRATIALARKILVVIFNRLPAKSRESILQPFNTSYFLSYPIFDFAGSLLFLQQRSVQ